MACANAANLHLTSGAVGHKELALRAAPGAGRARISRQLLTATVLLGFSGGALGLVLAAWSIHALRSQLPDFIQRLKDMEIDASVFAFSVSISIATGILFGFVPALRASRTDLNVTLKEAGGKEISGDTSQRARTVLLVAEVALAVVLLVVASRLDDAACLAGSEVSERSKLAAFTRSVLSRLETLPGARSGAAVNILAVRGSLTKLRVSAIPFQADGEPPAPPGQEPTADFRVVTPGFMEVLRIPLRKGRNFTGQDTADNSALC